MSEYQWQHDPTTDDVHFADGVLREGWASPGEPGHVPSMMPEDLGANYGEVLGQASGTSFTDPFHTRLPSSIPSGTSMWEHQWQHDPTTDDVHFADGVLREGWASPGEPGHVPSMMPEDLGANYGEVLGQASGTSFTDPFHTRLPSSIPSRTSMSENHWQHDPTTNVFVFANPRAGWGFQGEPGHIPSMMAEASGANYGEVLGQASGTSFTDPFHTRNLGANSYVWVPNPTMESVRIVSQLGPLHGGRPWVLCMDCPGVEPHFLQTPADCLPCQVHFPESSKLPKKVYAGDYLKNSDGSRIGIEMTDKRTGSIVSVGPQSSAEVTLMVLEGSSDTGNWIEVKPRGGKPPLLVGDVTVKLKEGKGCLGNCHFTDNSSFVYSKTFRLGLTVRSGSHIQGALSTAISVKDARGKSNVKKEIPEEEDTVDVLVNIAKNGAPLRNLNIIGIKTVKQLLLFYEKDPKALRNVLKHLPQKSFDATIKNAEKCLERGLPMSSHSGEPGGGVTISGFPATGGH